MTDTKFTREAVRQALIDIVEERGEDHVYPEEWRTTDDVCQYTVDGHGACIVGALIEKITGKPYEGLNTNASLVLYESYGVTDRLVIDAAVEAQDSQDHRSSWGVARDRALNIIDKVRGFA